MARGRGDRKYGVHPVSSHMSFSCPSKIISHFGSSARRGRHFAQQPRRRFYEVLRRAWFAGTARHRLASNSLLEGLVVAHRAATVCMHARSSSKQRISLPEWKSGNVQDVDEMVVIYHNWDEIRRLMWDYVGIVRTDKRLQRASARLRNLQREIREFYWNFKISVDLLELRNLATVAALIVDSALSRKESRGLHYTLDYPETEDRQFKRDTVLSRG